MLPPRPWVVGAALLGAAVLVGGTSFAVNNPNAPEKPDASATPELKIEHCAGRPRPHPGRQLRPHRAEGRTQRR